MRSISHHSASSGSAEWRAVFRANLNFAKKFCSVLTPEQRVKFAQAQFHGGRGRHGKPQTQSQS